MYERTLTYDALGRLASYQDEHEWQERGDYLCPDPFDLQSCYWETISHNDLVREESFTYDAVGNRTENGAVIEPGNRIVQFKGYTLSYDADGNLTGKQQSGWEQTFTWNTLGQLTEVVTNGTTTTFGYDGVGRRVRQTVGATTTRYLWDGDDLVAELDGAGNPIREYVYYPGVDRPHSVRTGGSTYYYATELPGHVVHLVDNTNTVVNSYESTPWGEPISATENVAQPLRFAAREYDADNRLYYVRARYYDAELGRFLSEDPIGLLGGLNPFTYAGNDPVNFRDPLGLCPSGQFRLVIIVDANTGEVIDWYYTCKGGGAHGLSPVTVTAPALDDDFDLAAWTAAMMERTDASMTQYVDIGVDAFGGPGGGSGSEIEMATASLELPINECVAAGLVPMRRYNIGGGYQVLYDPGRQGGLASHYQVYRHGRRLDGIIDAATGKILPHAGRTPNIPRSVWKRVGKFVGKAGRTSGWALLLLGLLLPPALC